MNAAANRIGDLAVSALLTELRVWPKPGLVSRVDSGSHADMDADTFRASAGALRPFFATLAYAAADGAGMAELRTIGRAAERAMLTATGGVNTHRGAIFGLGLLCAAAGSPDFGGEGERLGEIARRRWGRDILDAPVTAWSHGTLASRRYGVGGARGEAAAGFPHVYRVGLPALRLGLHLTNGDENAAGVQACFALIAEVADTNLLHRGGAEGLRFARRAAASFLAGGGVGGADWRARAIETHRKFVALRLSPGGSADLLAATLFVHSLESRTVPEDGISRRRLPCFAVR